MRLWALRHGESVANVAGEIVSAPGPRAFEWAALTERGRQQAAAVQVPTGFGDPVAARLVSSDFLRAVQTAQIVAAAWGAAAPVLDALLRERSFGTLEGASAENYDAVWAQDAAQEPSSWGAEAPEAVAARVVELLGELEGESAEGDVVLVAHGDVLQIAQTVLAGKPAHLHRAQPHLGNAELRRIG